MAVERVFRIYWGPTLENALDFTWPVVGSSPTFYRASRPQSVQLSNGANTVAWITGRYFRLQVTAQFFAGQQWAGGGGLQAFLDWAADSNAFTLVPNLNIPSQTVTGCYLEGPFTKLTVSLENDFTQTVQLTVLHPTVDLGLVWRGLFFEYAAGGSLADPVAYSFSRTSIGYELNNQGYLTQNPAGTLCDGNYPNPFVDGLQTALFEPAVTNDVTNPEALDNASWTKNFGTITANGAKAPDTNLTADLFIEDTTATAVHAVSSNAITITAGDKQTGLVFVRPAGRFNVIAMFNDSSGGAGGNKAGVQVNLHTGVSSALTGGTGTVDAFRVVTMSDGWFMIWWRGALNGAITSSFMSLRLGDGTGTFTYTGDGVSGMAVWGATAVHGVNNFVASYTPTTSAKDLLSVLLPAGVTPQTAIWIYIQGIEAGAALAASNQFPALLTIGTFGSVWRTIVDMNNGTAGRYSVNNGNNVASTTATAAAAPPTVGQQFELLAIIYPDQSVQLIQVVAGGAEVASSRSAVPGVAAPAAYPTVGGANTFFANSDGSGYGSDVHQIARVKVGAFVQSGIGAVTTLAAARVA